MARGYVSVKGKACNGKRAYLVKGKRTYKGKKAYVVKGGKTCSSWSGTESGEMVVTSSGTITIPSGVSLVDIFCVGGGGGAGGWRRDLYVKSDGAFRDFEMYGGGGGGGYTSTAFDVPVTPGETLTVTIGAGGRTGRSYYIYKDYEYETTDEYGNSSVYTDGANGGTTSVKRGSTTLCTASGGEGGGCQSGEDTIKGRYKGGDGGSGGSNGGQYDYINGLYTAGSNGGTDGEDGDTGSVATSHGVGQGSTTRAFEESNGTLYASGGDGAGSTASATANSGDGANVSIGSDINSSGYVDRYGGSGVVIIRWKEREV